MSRPSGSIAKNGASFGVRERAGHLTSLNSLEVGLVGGPADLPDELLVAGVDLVLLVGSVPATLG